MASYTSGYTGVEIDKAIGNANAMLLTGAADPTSATIGTLGQQYKNTATGALFRCVGIAWAVYTWESVYKKSEIDSALALKSDKATTDTAIALKANQTDMDSTRIEVSQANDKLTDLSNTLSTININNSPTQTITGYDRILSLPKNAANGNASVGVKGMTAQNLVVNGDFSNGTTGWTGYGTTLSVASNELTFTATTQFGAARNTGNYIAGNKCYVRALVKTDSSLVGLGIARTSGYTQTVKTHSGSGNYELLSGIITLNTPTSSPFVTIFDNRPSGWTAIKTKEVIAIDLTATFGAGNEPDLATCDKMFANYFDGTKSTKGRGRVRSVGKNLFNGKMESGTVSSVGISTVDSAKTRSKNFIPVKPSSTLYISNSLAYAISRICSYDRDKIFIATHSNGSTVSASAYYIRFSLSGTDLSNQVQLEQSATATTYEPYKESSLYLPDVDDLRSLPKGVCDEINGNIKIQRIGKVVVTGTENWYYGGVAPDETDWYYTSDELSDSLYVSSTPLYCSHYPLATIANNTTHQGVAIIWSRLRIRWGVKDTIENWKAYLAAQYAAGTPVTVWYQLATPIVTPVETSGTLLSYPSGSVYFEPVTADAGMYSNGMSILATGFPIASLETLSKVDFTTGIETPLDVATAVVAGNGLSFTHSGLANGNIVFFTYQFKSDNPEGNKTVSYLDSRYVVADTTNGKFYQWKIATTNGVPSITAVEVV